MKPDDRIPADGDAKAAELTAYALGELHGAEKAAVEARLAGDPAARAEVEAIREVATNLSTALGAEPAVGLSESQRAALRSAIAGGAASGAGATMSSLRAWRFSALAAALLVALVVWQYRDTLFGGADAGGQLPPALRTPPVTRVDTQTRPTLQGGQGGGGGGARGDTLGGAELADRDRLLYEANGMRSEVLLDGTPSVNTVTQSGQPVGGDSPFAYDLGLGAATANELSEAGGAAPVATAAPGTPAMDSVGLNDVIGVGGGGGQSPGKLGGPSAGGAAAAPSREELAVLSQLGYTSNTSTSSSGHFTGRGRKAVEAVAPDVAAQLRALGYLDSADDFESTAEADASKGPSDSAGPELRYSYARRQTPGTEGYQPIVEQGFRSPFLEPLSTFSIDVDTASYANVRRFLNEGRLPPTDAVRIEELVNYFKYDYPQPDGEVPFAADVVVTDCPWRPEHRLVRIGLHGREIPQAERGQSNLVFLVDVSGSMSSQDKLPLLVSSLKLLARRLDERDRVALVTYAGNAGLVLDSTSMEGGGRDKLLAALDNLRSGGSTHGSAGIRLAYETAVAHFVKGGVNRVILATDGDFNVGTTSRDELEQLIEQSAKSGVFLSVLGFGSGNLQDGTAELLADKGNGNYSYIDTLAEAQKVLVAEMGGTLVTIAKDVKIQVEFNPGRVGAYRLVGYENRMLAAQDFNDDKKDAGEIGAGHTVTALYEVVPAGLGGVPGIDPLKYQQAAAAAEIVESPELLTLKLRWKEPDADSSSKIEIPVTDHGRTLGEVSPDMSFAAAVATFGMLLRESDQVGSASWQTVLDLAEAGRGLDKDGWRAEFIRLAKSARDLSR